MRAHAAALLLAALLPFAGCAKQRENASPLPEKRAELTPVSYIDVMDILPEAAGGESAVRAALASCEAMFTGAPANAPYRRAETDARWGDKSDWIEACAALSAESAKADGRGAVAVYTDRFCPYEVNQNDKGLFTGYYLPVIKLRRAQDGVYRHPIYAPPAGHNTKTLYPARADIEKNGLKNAKIIAWTDDRIALFFLHIQGSGYGEYEDGTRVTLAYAGKNNRPYTSVGKELIERGVMPREEMNGASLKAALYADDALAAAVLPQNASYVFFREQPFAPVKGAAGAPLTSEHAIAVDPDYIPYFVPALIATSRREQDGTEAPFVRLTQTLDTGSAIKGAKRADIFFGAGEAARDYAYHQQHDGAMIVLLPRGDKARCDAPAGAKHAAAETSPKTGRPGWMRR